MNYSLTYKELLNLQPCEKELDKTIILLGDATTWNDRSITAAEAAEKGVSLENLMWVAEKLSIYNTKVQRKFRMFAADCAARVLYVFEKEYPTDNRPRNAIITARSDVNRVFYNAAWDAANSAAWDATTRYARLAAESAACSAASLISAAAKTAAYKATNISISRDAESKWQLERFILWFSDNEPEPWPI